MTAQSRLEQYEAMHGAVIKEYADTREQMDRLKQQGREKSATYRQLMGRRLFLSDLLSLYRTYSLAEEPQAAE